MLIGFPNNPSKNLYEELEWIARNDFDFADLFLECPIFPEKINIARVRRILANGMSATGHMAWYLPTGSSEKAIRDSAIFEAETYFAVFEQLSIGLVTVHANWEPGLSESECIKNQVASLKEMVKKAREYNIRLMYEPVDTPHDSLKNVAKVLDEVSGLLFHLDIGHANLHGRDPADFIEAFHRKLVHVHMHDNDGRSDLHMPLGHGSIDWPVLIDALKKRYNGTITLEIFSRDKEMVLKSRERLIELWEGK